MVSYAPEPWKYTRWKKNRIYNNDWKYSTRLASITSPIHSILKKYKNKKIKSIHSVHVSRVRHAKNAMAAGNTRRIPPARSARSTAAPPATQPYRMPGDEPSPGSLDSRHTASAIAVGQLLPILMYGCVTIPNALRRSIPLSSTNQPVGYFGLPRQQRNQPRFPRLRALTS